MPELLVAPLPLEATAKQLEIVERFSLDKKQREVVDALTVPQLFALHSASVGLTRRQTAAKLYISPGTLKDELRRAHAIVGSNNAPSSIRKLHEYGIFTRGATPKLSRHVLIGAGLPV